MCCLLLVRGSGMLSTYERFLIAVLMADDFNLDNAALYTDVKPQTLLTIYFDHLLKKLF